MRKIPSLLMTGSKNCSHINKKTRGDVEFALIERNNESVCYEIVSVKKKQQ